MGATAAIAELVAGKPGGRFNDRFYRYLEFGTGGCWPHHWRRGRKERGRQPRSAGHAGAPGGGQQHDERLHRRACATACIATCTASWRVPPLRRPQARDRT